MQNHDSTKVDIKYIFKMLRFMKPYLFAYIIGGIMYNGQSFVFPFILATFQSGIIQAIINSDPQGVITSVIVLLFMILGFLAIIGPGVYMWVMSIAKAMRDLKRQLFRSFVRNDIESAASSHSGEGIAAINTDSDTAEGILDMQEFLRNAVGIVFSSIAVIAIDWRVGLAVVGIGLLAFAAQSRFTKPLARIGKERLEANAESLKTVTNLFSGALPIRSFNMQNTAMITFDKDNNRLLTIQFRQAFIAMWQGLFTTVQGWFTLAAIFGLGGWLVANGHLEFHILMMFPPLAAPIVGGFSSIGEAWAGLQPPIVAAKRVFAILENPNNTPCIVRDSTHIDTQGYKIEIKDMNFRYLDAESDALSNINLEINENEMVAFVGESGSGKSTLLRAIIGLYERENLGMRISDISFNDVSATAWRRNFAYVDQSCKLFDMSIKENIAMGTKGSASDDEVVAAAKRAFAHDFIEEIAEGYNAPCGEQGATLSGGQKQRIAIARALVKKAPILVFDEATSALDKESERNIMDTIETLRGDHTILLTSHNLESIVKADKIVVMDGGTIVDIGTHDTLMAKDGLYRRLYTLHSVENPVSP